MKDTAAIDFLPFAERLADTARDIIRRSIERPITRVAKADGSPVTEVDRAVEQALREQIDAKFPEHGIIGEEFGTRDEDADYVWVLDPVDGTKAFITAIPTYATLIALAYRGVPVLGVIDQPVLRDRWVGVTGTGTTHNGNALHTRSCRELSEALLCTNSVEPYQGDDQLAWQRLRGRVEWAVYGGGCCAYGSLAAGNIDIGIAARNEPFDYCAIAPVVEGAGGVMTDWQGNRITIRSDHRFVAVGDPKLHERVLKVIAGAP